MIYMIKHWKSKKLKYDVYQCGLASMAYEFFTEKNYTNQLLKN